MSYANLRTRDVSSNQETSLAIPEHFSTSLSLPLSTKSILGQANLDAPSSLTLPRRFSTYAERISTTSSFSDGTSFLVGSPKTKKTGAETREELLNNILLRQEASAAIEKGTLPVINVRKPDFVIDIKASLL